MQMLKQIKSKALSIPFFEKKPGKQEQKAEGKGENKEAGVKSIAKSILGMFKQDGKSVSQSKAEEEPKDAGTKVVLNQQGRIWMTAPAAQPAAESQPQNKKVQQKQVDLEGINVDQESAGEFVVNLQRATVEGQKQDRMKINKAKNQIFGNLQIQPIYLSDNLLAKILAMEISANDEHTAMVERTQTLVMESNNVDRAIESALVSGYLWEAHGLPNRNIIEVCYETIEASSNNVSHLHGEVVEVREKFKMFQQYFRKVNSLNRRRMAIAKKLDLLKSIKEYRKDICQQFCNLDQAFYIERSRQKHYLKLKGNPAMASKVTLLQSILATLRKQNEKIVGLVESQLGKWVDQGKKLEVKHIEKLLILLYFTRHQRMYTEANLKVDLSRLKNKAGLVGQLNEVKKWKDYKYVNDRAVKARVNQFLDQLIKWLVGEQQVIKF